MASISFLTKVNSFSSAHLFWGGGKKDKKQKTYSISLTVLRIVNVTLNPFPVVLPHQGKERFIPNWSTLETMLFQVSEE